jgi:hypothetical protein
MGKDTIAVVLDSDVASVFKTSAAVNRALRSAIRSSSEQRPSKVGQPDNSTT